MVTKINFVVNGADYDALLERACGVICDLVGESRLDAVHWDIELIEPGVELLDGTYVDFQATIVGQINPAEMS